MLCRYGSWMRRSAAARRSAARLGALGVGVLLAAAAARGDGGLMRLSEMAGPFEITVFTAPTPLRVGAVDVSVMLLERAGHAPVLDAAVDVTVRGPGPERTGAATHAAATNKLLYAAVLDISAAGQWSLLVQVRSNAGAAAVSCPLDVAPPLAPVVAFWPYLALPAVAIALFALHQSLKHRQARARRSYPQPPNV